MRILKTCATALVLCLCLSAPGLVNAESKSAPEKDSYNIKLRAIEERVNELKEKIFQSKARLIQLQEVVLQGSISGAKAVLIHRNDMGSSFRLSRAQYALDGTPIFNRFDMGTGDLGVQHCSLRNQAIH